MRWHHRSQQLAQALVGQQILGKHLIDRPIIDRQGHVGIRARPSVAWKVLGAMRHALCKQSADQRAGQHGDHARIVVKSAIADDFRLTIIKIQYRYKTEINAAGALSSPSLAGSLMG